MISLKQLSKIDIRTKHAVYGWIREQEKSLKLSNIPNMITAVCILFSRKDDVFQTFKAKEIKFSTNGECVKFRDTWKMHTPQKRICIRGRNEIISTDINGPKQWDLKINECTGKIGVGISYNDCYSYLYFNDARLESYWKYQWDVDCNYGYNFGKGDKISICLDLDRKELKYVLNGVDLGIAFNNIEQRDDVKYKLLVVMYRSRSVFDDTVYSVEIENFKGL